MSKFLAVYDPVDLEYINLIIEENKLSRLAVVDGKGENLITAVVYSKNSHLDGNSPIVEAQLLVVKDILEQKGVFSETLDYEGPHSGSYVTQLDHNGNFIVARRDTTDAYLFDLPNSIHPINSIVVVNRYKEFSVDGILVVGEHNAVRAVRRFIKYRLKQDRIFKREQLNEIVSRAAHHCKVFFRTTEDQIIDITTQTVVDRSGHSLGRLDSIVAGYNVITTVWTRALAASPIDRWDVLAYKIKPAAFLK